MLSLKKNKQKNPKSLGFFANLKNSLNKAREKSPLVFWVFLGALLLVLYFRAINPSIEYLAGLKEQTQTMQQSLNVSKAIFDQEKTDLAKLKTKALLPMDKLAKNAADDLKNKIGKLAKDSGLVISSLVTLKPKTKVTGDLAQITIQIITLGDFKSLHSFLKKLGSINAPIMIEKCIFDHNNNKINMETSIKAIYLK